MKSDLVLAATKKFDWPSIREYVVSLDQSGYKGRKIMFVDGITDWSRRKLVEYGWELIDFTAVEPVCNNRLPGWMFSVARWTPVVEYLREHHDEFRYIVWTDIGDVIFQSDPATWLEKNIGTYQLVAATEASLIGSSGLIADWIQHTTPGEWEWLKDKVSCCAGTLAGTSEAFYTIAKEIKELLAAAGPQSVDQAALDYLLHSRPEGQVWIPGLEHGWACTCSWVIGLEYLGQPQLPPIEGTVFPIVDRGNGRIYTGDESPKLFSIVHQYNRDPELTAAINKRFHGPEPKVLIAIKSCAKYQTDGTNDAVRNSWLRDIKQFPNADYKFFITDGPETKDDEFEIKIRHGELWYSLTRQYDYTFVVCPDTLVHLDRLMKSGFDREHYSGRDMTHLYGPCCWLSKDAIKIVVGNPDKPVKEMLHERGIGMAVSDRHQIRQLPRRTNDIISTFIFDTETRAGEKWEPNLIEKKWLESQRAQKPAVMPRSSMRGMRNVNPDPRVLIAISSCALFQQNGNNDAVRDTWARDVQHIRNLDYVFFTGGKAEAKDEVHLDVPDDYAHVTWKTVAGHEWAIKEGYDFIFQTFPDVYIRPERLMAALDTRLDYVGFPLMDGHPYASGGAGYMLSSYSSKYLLLEGEPWDWAEDRWVGEIMLKNGFVLYADRRYSSVAYPPLKRNAQITSHLSRGTGNYNKQWMYNTHKFWTLSQDVT